MYVSNTPMEPSALKDAIKEEASRSGNFSSGVGQVVLILVGSLMVGVALDTVWRMAKRTYRTATGRETNMGGLMIMLLFAILGLIEWVYLEFVACEGNHLMESLQWTNPTRRFFVRTFNGIVPAIAVYVYCAYMLRWRYTKSILPLEERRAIPKQFAIAIMLLMIANVGVYFGDLAEQDNSSPPSLAVIYVFVGVMLLLATRALYHWIDGMAHALRIHSEELSPSAYEKREWFSEMGMEFKD
ncbi:hypothetical protein TRVA0_013S03136 [Trichomonascus vanleenenianus]|uniref:uncharacterized protein n=1 Tax=Trichomonascus vanleenenianus TaxID=2268995 RepID=UPI003ECB2036